MVVARQKQQSIALRSKLVVLLYGVNSVDRLLDGRRRHGWIKDQNIRAEIRARRASRHSRARNADEQG